MNVEKIIIKKIYNGTYLNNFIVTYKRYIFVLSFLTLVFIGHRFRAEKLFLQKVDLQEEIRNLRSESIIVASDLMFLSKESEVLKLAKSKNLKLEIPTKPAIKIIKKQELSEKIRNKEDE